MIGVTDLLAADDAVPQRDLLLDPIVLHERIAGCLDSTGAAGIESVGVQRVKYRVGDSLRIVVQVRSGGRVETISARTFAPDQAAEVFAAHRATARPVHALAGIGIDRELATVFWTFPNDRKLELSAFADPDGPLQRFVGRQWSTAHLVSYMPEKLAILRCDDRDGTALAYAKRYVDDAGGHTARVHRRLRSEGIDIARVRAWVPSSRTLVVDAMPGIPFADLIGPPMVEAAGRLGASLAALHGTGVPRAARFVRHDGGRIRSGAAVLGRARPAVGVAAVSVAASLMASVARETDVCLHGDLHMRNVLATNDGVTLIDLDNVARGPAAADLGGLLAVFAYRGIIGDWSVESSRATAAALLGGYSDVRALPERRALRWHTAAALLVERALRAVNRVRAAGIEHLDGILTEADAILAGVRDV